MHCTLLACLCALWCGVSAYPGSYYLLEDILHRLDQMLAADSDYSVLLKRGPPLGFAAARGKRHTGVGAVVGGGSPGAKRFPSQSEFFGARGKKDGLGKRLPSSDEFFGARGKKMVDTRVEEERYPMVVRSSKRMPGAGEFFGSRGKKAQDYAVSDQGKRVPNNFFGARGKKSQDYAVSDQGKRVPNNFFGARGKKSDLSSSAAARLLAAHFVRARGKKSDKRILASDFFGARGRRSDGQPIIESETEQAQLRQRLLQLANGLRQSEKQIETKYLTNGDSEMNALDG